MNDHSDDERLRLYRIYGAILENVLDMNGIEGDRSIAKKLLHRTLKKTKGIVNMRFMKKEDLKSFIDELNDFFPLENRH